MKKIALLCLAAFGALSLTGCDFIKDALSSKDKDMTYDEFLDEFRDSDAGDRYTKAIETDKTATPEKKYEYTHAPETHTWVRSVTTEIEGLNGEPISITVDVPKFLEAYYFAMDIKSIADSKDKDVDEVFDFTSVNKGEEFTIKVKEEEVEEGEEFLVTFTDEGLMKSYVAKTYMSGVDTWMNENYVYSFR